MLKRFVRKCLLAFILVSLFITSTTSAFAINKPANGNTTVKIFPSKESTINGIPESQIIRPMDVLVGPCFDGYSLSSYVEVKKFKQIAAYEHDNTRNTESFDMSVTVSQSTSQGSEWSGNVQFNAEIKAGILGKIGISTGITHKETRSTNEAVGSTGSMTVDPGKTGYINFYYKGRTCGGTLRYYTYNTLDMVRHYFEVPVTTTCYRAPYLDVFSDAYQL